MKARIYHNPRCSKSRAALALLEQRGVAVEIVHYLDTPPPREEIEGLLAKLRRPAADVVRMGEPAFAASGLARDAAPDALLDLLAAHPMLLERPIVVVGDRARIGRPPERILELFE